MHMSSKKQLKIEKVRTVSGFFDRLKSGLRPLFSYSAKGMIIS